MVSVNICGNLRLPFVAVQQQLLFVVQQLLVRLGRKLEIRSLDNGIDRAGFLQIIDNIPIQLNIVCNILPGGEGGGGWGNKRGNILTNLTESAVNTLGHVDIVARCPAATVGPLLRLDGDRLRRANGLAQFARDASLLAARIAAQRVLATEPWTQRPLFERIVYRGRLLEDVAERDAQAANQFG